VLARQKRRQHPHLTRQRLRALPSGQPQRPDRSGRDHGRPLVTATNRPQPGIDVLTLAGGDVDGVNARLGARAGRPGVADLAAEAAAAVVVDHEAHIHPLCQAARGVG
jgi:hypothetical protein